MVFRVLSKCVGFCFRYRLTSVQKNRENAALPTTREGDDHIKGRVLLILLSIMVLAFGAQAASPSKQLEIPADMDKDLLLNLSRTHDNRGMRQQYALEYADRFPEGRMSASLLFNAARYAELYHNAYIDLSEREYLDGDQFGILDRIIDRYQGTDHAVTAEFFQTFIRLHRQEDNRRFGRNVDQRIVNAAVDDLKDYLDRENIGLTVHGTTVMLGVWSDVLVASGDLHPASMFNIAYGYELLNDWWEGLRWYENFVDTFPDNRNRISAESRIVVLRDTKLPSDR